MRAPSCRCGEVEFWKVREMQDHAFFQTKPLGDIDEVAPLDTLICTACGRTIWHSRSESLRERRSAVGRIVDDRARCEDCDGRSHLLVALIHEWPAQEGVAAEALAVTRTGWGSAGQFALLVCTGCGRCEWFAWGFVGQRLGKLDRECCPRCSARERYLRRPLREDGGDPLPVAVQGGVSLGEFEVRFCGACGYTDWYARGIERLRADGEHVLHIQGERPRAPAAGGPYR